MKTFSLSAPWDERSTLVSIKLDKYANGRTRINLLDAADNEPYAVATTNLPDVLLLDNEVLVKDYSENEGMTEFLTTNNIVVPTNNWVSSGFVDLQVCTLNPESEWGLIPNTYSDETPEYDNKMDPAPDEIDTVSGKSKWIIKDYKIWATSYQEALKHLDIIENL
jgi:hypothetical protein